METIADPGAARRELVLTWATAIALLGLARVASSLEPTGLLRGNLGALAAVLFVVLPERELRRRGEGWAEQGLPWWGAADGRTWRAWAKGAGWALAIGAAVFPLFVLAFWGWAELAPRLPGALAQAAPGPLRLEPRLPPRFALLAASQFLVVALPEEMFYRGFLQTAWARTDPGRRRRVLGAEIGAGFLPTQALFAAGHLLSLEPWRLATFFPGLLFGWARARTGGLAAPVVLHLLSNLLLATLEASLAGAR